MKDLILKTPEAANKFKDLIDQGVGPWQAFCQVKTIMKSKRSFVVKHLSKTPALCLGTSTLALPALGILPVWTIVIGAFATFLGGLLMGFALEEKLSMTYENLLATLSAEEQERIKQEYLALQKKTNYQKKLLTEYQNDPQVFVLNYFGVYSPELCVRIKAGSAKNSEHMTREGYLSQAVDPESEIHKELRSWVDGSVKVTQGAKI